MDQGQPRALVERYLGGTESESADRLLEDGRAETRIRIGPDRIYSWDFSDQMAGVSGP